MGIFYADDSLDGLRDPEWNKVSLNRLIGLFRWYRLVANVS